MNKNFYDILEINKSASQQEIKVAYRNKIKEYHPDKFQNNLDKEEATRITQILNHIYDILSNNEKREEYNQTLERKNSSTKTYFQNRSDNFSSKVTRSIGGLGISLLVLIILNFGLDIFQKQFYKTEKNQIETLKIEISTLENYFQLKNLEIEQKYNFKGDLERIKNYENEIKKLEGQEAVTKDKFLRKKIIINYNEVFKLYEITIEKYNKNLAEYKNNEFKDLQQKSIDYENKIKEYNELAKKIKSYRIVPRGIRIK